MPSKISKHYLYQLVLPKKLMYKITPKLFIGGEKASTNYKYLKKNGITHVINCAKEVHVTHPPDVLSWNYNFSDSPCFPIHRYFEETHNLLDGIIREDSNNKILIACQMGINRSMTILCEYLHHSTNKNIDEIINDVANIRKCCMLTNLSFYRQLKNLNDKYTLR